MSQSLQGFRLSRQQERVLNLASTVAAARTVACARLSGALDRELLECAAHDVVSVHESLRTAYRRVLGENSAMLAMIENEPRIRMFHTAGDDSALAAIIGEQSHAPAYESVLNLILFTHTDKFELLIVSAPRMSMDSGSVGIFFRDLQQAYATRVNGTPWTRDDVVQYADFTQWQVDQAAALTVEQEELAAERQAKIAGLAPLRLPLELRSSETDHDDMEWALPASLARSLRSLGTRFGGGLRSVLLTGWVVALWHACGRPECLAVDATLPGRRFHELLTAIGHFETPMPVFAGICDETTLDELLSSVDQQLDLLEQADEGFLASSRQANVAIPSFALSDAAEFPLLAALNFSDLWVEPCLDGRKVGLWVQDTGEEIHVKLRRQRFGMAAEGADALLICLRASLQALGGDGSAAVSSLSMLDQDAACALVKTTNPLQPQDGPAVHWHRQVEATAEQWPDRIAITSDTRAWSFRELDEAANRLAHELIDRGVAARDLVGLCLERSDLAVVAMLAIAKAGAGYVPVDPHLPLKRQSLMRSAVGFRHAVATAETASEVLAGCDVILVDADLKVCAHRSSERPPTETADDDPVYVLFTSGSTGTPKGVLVGHGQLAAYLDGVLERLGLNCEVKSVALSTLGTDLGNTALFAPLMTGGELRIVASSVSADAQALADHLARETYDLIKMTPSHLEAVIAVAEEPEKLIPRNALVLGGEPLSWGTYNLLQGFLGDCKLYNHYGPTETTVGVICGQVSENDLASLTSTVPLGRPMRHARTYILDPQLRPLPVGVSGELWIGGSTVSQGYLMATEDVEDRFADDPFSPIRGARMYRSGDKARLLPDLSIEFLGRVDRQVKIRGFRVELGEIEAIMRQHPRVKGSIVVPSGEGMAVHLVGYLCDAEGSRGPAEWLREFLTQRLPEFMVPAHLVALDGFPLTSTGKIDASMLPEPGSYSAGSMSFVEPRTATERTVAHVIANLLLLNGVGAEDDFFEIGGHSLLATKLIAELRHEFKVDVKLRDLFEWPVVSELAGFIDQLLERKAAGNHD